jgi:pseudouridine kinase
MMISSLSHLTNGHALVIGSAGMDIVGRAETQIETGTSNPSALRMSLGGVARNVAENIALLGMDVVLITAVGDDPQGERLLKQTAASGVNVDHVLVVPDQPTGSYLAMLDHRGNLHIGMDDMRVISSIESIYLRERRDLFKEASAVFVDTNLPRKTLSTAISLAHRAKVPIAANPASVSLAPTLAPHLAKLWLITPNETEADAICPHPVPHAEPDRAIQAARHLVSEGVDFVVITMAEFGLSYASADSSGHVPAVQTEILDPTGAGDALTAAVIFGLLNGIPLDETVQLGLSAAAVTLRTQGTVARNLSLEMLYDQLR